MKYIREKLTLLLLVIVSISGFGSSYDEAVSAYKSGDYNEAAELLQGIAEKEGVSAGLLYDLGNAYCAQGKLGEARLYYERAHRLAPRNKKISSNLEYVSSKVDDANRSTMTGKRVTVDPDPVGFLGRINRNVTLEHTSDSWALMALIAFLLTLAMVASYLFATNIIVRKIGFFSAILFIFFSVVFIVFSFLAKEASGSHDYGVITAYKLELLTEPASDSKPSCSPLNQGTKVRIVSEESDVEGNVAWYKVRLNSDYQGWIPASEFEVI